MFFMMTQKLDSSISSFHTYIISCMNQEQKDIYVQLWGEVEQIKVRLFNEFGVNIEDKDNINHVIKSVSLFTVMKTIQHEHENEMKELINNHKDNLFFPNGFKTDTDFFKIKKQLVDNAICLHDDVMTECRNIKTFVQSYHMEMELGNNFVMGLLKKHLTDVSDKIRMVTNNKIFYYHHLTKTPINIIHYYEKMCPVMDLYMDKLESLRIFEALVSSGSPTSPSIDTESITLTVPTEATVLSESDTIEVS